MEKLEAIAREERKIRKKMEDKGRTKGDEKGV